MAMARHAVMKYRVSSRRRRCLELIVGIADSPAEATVMAEEAVGDCPLPWGRMGSVGEHATRLPDVMDEAWEAWHRYGTTAEQYVLVLPFWEEVKP